MVESSIVFSYISCYIGHIVHGVRDIVYIIVLYLIDEGFFNDLRILDERLLNPLPLIVAEKYSERLSNGGVAHPEEDVVVLFAEDFSECLLYLDQWYVDDHHCKCKEIYYSESTNDYILMTNS